MRDAIDDLAMQKIDISSVRIIGMVVVASIVRIKSLYFRPSGDIYRMAQEVNGLNAMRSYSIVFTTRSHKDLGGLAIVTNVF
ncbi:hypothetical protein FBU30_005903 [Linnemannia zychae]|nr:hypothetical protein FBU30_005903 [Linnemannia zychae]